LSFNVFNITNIKNKVNAKYNRKNKTTEAAPVFLAIKNQTRASIISSINFNPRATRERNVWLRGCLLAPMVKTTMAVSVTKAKSEVRISISEDRLLIFAAAVIP